MSKPEYEMVATVLWPDDLRGVDVRLMFESGKEIVVGEKIFREIRPSAKRQEPLTWTTDLPTEPGWYWIRRPYDGGHAAMRHLSRCHGEWYFDGRLSAEIPSGGFSTKVERLDTLWMQQAGCKFYGPLQAPK